MWPHEASFWWLVGLCWHLSYDAETRGLLNICKVVNKILIIHCPTNNPLAYAKYKRKLGF